MKTNIISYLKQTVSRYPHKPAVTDSLGVVSFLELDELSDKIAVAIYTKVTALRTPVAVFLPKNSWAILSFIGIFKSGNFYVPLDVKSPRERLLKMLNTLDTPCIITDNEHKGLLVTLGYKGQIIIVDQTVNSVVGLQQLDRLNKIANQVIDLDPVYSIFTSGTTGNPKGVLISHKGVFDFIEWAIKTYLITQNDIIGNQVPLHFDVATLDIYLMLFTGASLHIIPENKFTFPIKLIEYVNENDINFVIWVPSVLINVSNFNAFESIKPTALNKVLFAGEVMPNKHLNYWRTHYPKALYSNLYGPTETTVIATYFIVDRFFEDDEPLPIGKPCGNIQTLILTKEGLQVDTAEIGELCVRGSSLALGYYNDIEKTNLSFVQNPLHDLYPDIIYKTGDLVYENDYGEIEFVGRKDSQIKHMGYRIELGEIQTAILGIQGIENTCVLYDHAHKKIVAFYISNIAAISSKDIRKALVLILPKYMIPTKWIQKKLFPLNANGKIHKIELSNEL